MRFGGEAWRGTRRVMSATALVVGSALALAGCGAYLQSRAWQAGFLNGQHRIMVFGGPTHTTYLGCLSCAVADRDSVFTGGPSVVNPQSDFVSVGSAYSACNPFATDPPLIVDERGKYYGRLTVNQSRPDGPPTDDLRGWIVWACGWA